MSLYELNSSPYPSKQLHLNLSLYDVTSASIRTNRLSLFKQAKEARPCVHPSLRHVCYLIRRVCYLIRRVCFRQLKEARPCVHPNPGFWRALQIEQARLQEIIIIIRSKRRKENKNNPPWRGGVIFAISKASKRAPSSNILLFAHSRSTHKETRKKKNGVHRERCLRTSIAPSC